MIKTEPSARFRPGQTLQAGNPTTSRKHEACHVEAQLDASTFKEFPSIPTCGLHATPLPEHSSLLVDRRGHGLMGVGLAVARCTTMDVALCLTRGSHVLLREQPLASVERR